jgi:(1->4)-alpha-D-glucan 1-alpha-D-glucosylmutase
MPDPKAVQTVLGLVTEGVLRRRRLPEATYRLQFHAGFTFRDAERLVPYLHDLGVTDCYASPYLKARPGSTHGYDIQDHRVLNPEIGTEADYNAFVDALHRHGLGQVLDTVPNHMGIVGNENVWWNDVLENGPSSPYAAFFDIDWYSYKPSLHEKLLLPMLGEPFGKVLEAGQLQLRYDQGAFTVHYFEHRFPVAPDTYGQVLGHRIQELEQRLGPTAEPFVEYQSIRTAIAHLPSRSVTEPAKVAERQREKEVIKRRLATLTESSPDVRAFVEENVAAFNGRPGDSHSFDLLEELLAVQAYRLCFWRVAADEINYRRFFDINELAALSMERPEVFLAAHELILRLVREGKVNGLRIDHPDGLFDPKQYLDRLQKHYLLERAHVLVEEDPAYREVPWSEWEPALAEAIRTARQEGPASPLWRPLFVVVEKILGKGEPIPEDWPVYGTTGYAFANRLCGLFVESENAPAFTRIYERWSGLRTPLRDVVYQNKFLILQVSLSGELHMLAHQLDRLAQAYRWSRDFTLNSLRHALREIIACFPVYRSYITAAGVPKRDLYYVFSAVARAKRKNPAISASIFDFVRDTILLKEHDIADEAMRAQQVRFVGKFQQVTSPVMAKGLEDTTFYVFNRLLSLNEVGGDPDQFGVSVAAFHRGNQDRQAQWPYTLSTTSTHDTKRSEDVRARLNVLSEMPREWHRHLTRWKVLNRRYKVVLEEEGDAPDRNEEYLFYETLVGAWPLEPYGPEEYAQFVERIQQYMQKSIHEAKVHTSWTNPNPSYDEAVRRFVASVLDPEKNARFVDDVRAFLRQVIPCGLWNGLAQALLKITSPGVPDLYQGTELWDFSLVDPDNRRPVDYALRGRLLRQLREQSETAGADRSRLVRSLAEQKEDGRVKLYVTSRALHCRREHPGLFSVGEYTPLDVLGSRAEHVCAFLRRQEGTRAIVAVPRLLTHLLAEGQELPLGEAVWQDTLLVLPPQEEGARYYNLFTGTELRPSERGGKQTLRLADLLADCPVALLLARE